jgi:hypothetical protein
VHDTREDVATTQKGLPVLHELCYGVLAISDAFLKLRCDESSGFGEIELQTTGQSLLSERPGLHDV